jgi:hypothetical protein
MPERQHPPSPANDLTPHEAPLAEWFRRLPYEAPPEAVARGLWRRFERGETAGSGRALFPQPRLRLAAAAALLLAVGVAVVLYASGTFAPARAEKVLVVEDPSLGLYHDLETFDRLGALEAGGAGALIADWGR